jgi:eukaryotic-like serine/threonine-protein kinase
VPATGADHNLLVGVLALQLDFVTRDELIDAACDSSGAAQSEGLIETLRKRGTLDDDECDLLVALVNRHLARHGNDPLKSLAQCDGADHVRELLTAAANGDRPRVRASAETINFAAHESDPHATRRDDPVTTTPAGGNGHHSDVSLASASSPTMPYSLAEARRAADAGASQPLSTPASLRFRIIRAFQRGGLGQVSLAHDAELSREVALKEILPKHADSDEARQRFLMEAEITGSLEHPGVVPVYGLGQYADGRPFYAMRFIRGDNMLLAIDEYHRLRAAPDSELRFRQLLGRFVAVCNAMEYAHNRSVLHRDLKPANIMLGKYGETLVVDWGLAKAIGVDSHPVDSVELPVRPASAETSTQTQLGRVVGTPAYMSPEQASGRVDILGPATDIYSLGATLYHILTGQAPFGVDDWEELLGNVQMGRFDAPRALIPDIAKPLEAICLKAMAKRPTDRYATARHLADDIERYLADEPVAAYAEPLSARVWRWMRRHRAAVVGTGAVLTVIATSLAVGVVLLNAANNRAERNFEIARNAIRDYYVTVSEDTLLDQPGMQPLREQLLRQALEYYQQFLATEQHGEAIRDELAQASYFAGRITEAIDSPADAIPYYEQAAALNEELVDEAPNDEKRLYTQALTLNALGGVMQRLDRLDESQRYYEAAENVRQQLVDAHPENVEYVRTLANTTMNLGTVDARRGDEKRGVQRWQEAQRLRTSRLRTGEEDPRLVADAGKGDFNLGLHYSELGDIDAARERFVLAVESFERVRELAPDDLASQFLLAQTYRELGNLLPTEDGPEAAQAYFDKALELLTTLTVRSPQVAEYKATLGGMQIAVADMLLVDGQNEPALAAIEQAIGPLTELVTEHPHDLLYQRDLAVALRLRGQIHLAAGDGEAALADARKAVEMLEELFAADPTDEDFREQLEIAQAALEEAE